MKRLKIEYLVLALLTVVFSWSFKGKQDDSKNNNKTENKMNTIELTKEEFLKRVVNYEINPTEWKYLGDKPCIIDFYASWCGPCKQIAPVLEELSKEYEGQIYIYKIDTEKETDLASTFGIQSIPTLLFCPKDGKPQMIQGSMPKASLKEAIEEVLIGK